MVKSNVIVFIIFAVLFIGIVLFLAINFILLPSLYSTQISCLQGGIGEIEDFLGDRGRELGGITSIDQLTGDINVTLFDKSERTVKHESIHVSQALSGRIKPCGEPIGIFINEIEAYTGSYYPNFIFVRLYDEF